MKRNREGVLLLTGFLLAERARAGANLQSPKVISAVVDAAELAVEEIDRRFDAADAAERAKLPPLPEPSTPAA